jgi:hypothetical protein
MLWSVIFLTLPQLLSWLAAQGIVLPPQSGNINSPWVLGVETSFNNFVSDILVARLILIFAAFFVLKAALDAAQGQNPLGSIVTAIFLLAASSTVQLMRTWNSSSEFATADMLGSIWNFLAGTILPEAAGAGRRRGDPRSYNFLLLPLFLFVSFCPSSSLVPP